MVTLKRCFPTLPVAGKEEHLTARVLGVISPPRANSLHPPAACQRSQITAEAVGLLLTQSFGHCLIASHF